MPKKLAQQLITRGLLPAATVEEALRRQTISGGTLDTILLERAAISEGAMLQALSDASGLRLVNLADFEPNHEVAGLVPAKITERLNIAPLSVDGSVLHLASTYPVPAESLHEVGFLVGRKLEVWVALECRVHDWISALYQTPLGSRYASLLAELDPNRPKPAPAPGPAPELVEASTLEESLTRDMVEQLAQAVIEEPILLEAKKPATGPEREPAPTPVSDPPAPPSPPPLAAHPPADPAPALAQEPAPAPAAPPSAPAVPRRPKTQPEFALSSIPIQHEPWRVPEPSHAIATSPEPLVEAPSEHRAPAAPASGDAPAPLELAATTTLPEPWTFTAPEAPAPTPLAATTTQPELWAVVPPAPTGPAPTRREPWALPEHELSQAVASPAPPSASGPEEPIAEPPADSPDAPAAAAVASEPEIPDWTLAEARQKLKEASRDRHRIIEVALHYARRAFDFTAAFAVVRGTAVGWEARGEGAELRRISEVSVPLDAASVFRTVAMTRGSYVGPLPTDALSTHFLGLFGRAPRTLFLCPVEVKSRLVAILYGDSGSRPMSQRRVSDFILFCQDLPAAFQELIVSRKQRNAEALTLPGPAPTPAFEPPTQPLEPEPVPALRWGGWSPSSSDSPRGLGRTVSMPALVLSQVEHPPPDFAPILRRLLGPDAARRARAMAELARTPEASARVLAAAFPGPTAWSRLPVVELPEADELGPIPAALSRLGRSGAHALAQLLDSPDSDTRYLALLTAGNLAYAELVDGVLRGLFDLEPDLSSAARAAVAAFKHLPRFDTALKDLRQELVSRDPLRRSLAARALGCLHDRESIDALIALTEADDQMCAKAASDALWEITRVAFGTNPKAWISWWAENRGRHRVEWLVAALRHPDLESRMAAIEELSKAFHDTLGYLADGSAEERESGARRWETALAQSPRGPVS